MYGLLRHLFFGVLVRLFVLVVLGLNVRHRERLPKKGPCIVVANHNSHLDTLVLMSLLGTRLLRDIRPVAAADYFLRSKLLAWFATRIIGILPIERKPTKENADVLAPLDAALNEGRLLILFPEGSRGQPERLEAFKGGVARLAERHPDVPVTPVFLHGLGKALPKGEGLLVPFFCDVIVGEIIHWPGDRRAFMECLNQAMTAMSAEGKFPAWT